MGFTELKAEVFSIVRNNQDKTKKQIHEILKSELPKVSKDDLARALFELSK